MTINTMEKGSLKEIEGMVAENIRTLTPYPPGKPIEELERELGIKGSIKLASNENPLGPSPRAVEALKKALLGVNRYPDGSSFYLKKKLSEKLGVSPDMLFIGNGSNEAIELLIRAFLGAGEGVVFGEPSFAVYPIATKAAGGSALPVQLKEGFAYDLDEMAASSASGARIVFLANPNNPTGTMVGKAELDDFISKLPDGTILCLDEAYFEYVRSKDFPDSLEYVRQGLPVVVLRTFSKIYGLAGLRIGYAVAPREIVDYMERVRQPFNVNSLAQAAALAALDDSEHIEHSRDENQKGLDYLFKELASLGYETTPTEANFFLVKVGDGSGVYESLLKQGVIVRPMASYGLGEYIRVTVGTGDENERFIESLSGL